ncbi:MAG TPA: metalloprotease PmbA [Gammaproteobacteria bacterium]|nr:metalloprotease PmbA [Gammaproteobacteria bacterium]
MGQIQTTQLGLDGLKGLAELVLDEAKRQGATSAEVDVSVNSGLSVTARLGAVETLEHHKDQGVAVTVYLGTRKGSSSSSDLDAGALKETVRAACRIARYTAEDECAGLADAALMAHDYPDLDLDHPWNLSAEQAIGLAIECETAARDTDPRISNSEGATVSHLRGTAVYGNTHGFIGGYRATRHSLSCAVIGQQMNHMQRDYWYSVARDSRLLDSPQTVGRIAAERTLKRLGARRLGTCQAPVLFEAGVARSLLGHFVGAVSGGALYRKASFLLDHAGKQVFPNFVHIHEQPHLKRSLGSAPFDDEGVATQPRDLVIGGVLQGYVLSSYSARRLGLKSTGNAGGVRNLIIDPGTCDLAGLMKQMDTGLLVTELIGHGVNMVTGDYSRGAAGFWVEGGEIQYPVEEITIAGNLKDMFLGLQAVGNDIDKRGNIRSGSILIERMTVAGE